MRYDADPPRDLAILFLLLIETVTKLFCPGSARSIVVCTSATPELRHDGDSKEDRSESDTIDF